MIRPDFSERTYIAEVLRVSNDSAAAAAAIERLIEGKWQIDHVPGANNSEITIYHGLVASSVQYHKVTRTLTSPESVVINIPRTKVVRRREHYLYDLLVVQRGHHLIVAVPFHGLATDLFLKIDNVLAGTRSLYERLNITNLVIQLGATGRKTIAEGNGNTALVVTRCNLAYDDPVERRRYLDQVRLTGSNLGASDIYAELIQPVLQPTESVMTVTPVLLGFALFSGGVRKSSAITDRHGNFKISVAPGLRQVIRLFQLLDEVEGMKNVVSTTSNVPILQSSSIEGVE